MISKRDRSKAAMFGVQVGGGGQGRAGGVMEQPCSSLSSISP